MQPVARAADLPPDRPFAVEIGEESFILVRDGDAIRAFQGKCPHAKAPLAEGAICNGRIVCPWHKARFDVTDGALLDPPALAPLKRFQAERRGDDIFLDPTPLPDDAADQADDPRHFVILGAGAAGAAAIATLREFGFNGRLTLIGPEPKPPYDRTALSKFVMEGAKSPDEVPPLLEADFYRTHQIDCIQATATGLDPAARTVTLDDGRTIGYDAALLATGGAPNRLDIPGVDHEGVHTLRSLADSAAIVADAQPGGRAVVIGGSFIGLEVAAGLKKRGLEVAVVSPEPIPFAKQFGPELGRMFRTLHETNGVRFHAPSEAARLHGNGRVTGVELADGTLLPADLVIIGVGVHPATGFVQSVALEPDGSVRVDEQMRVAPSLFAAGDVARFPLGGGATRIEHWRVAQQHARTAARAMLDDAAPGFDGVPFFWTYHFGMRFEYLGHATEWDETVVDGDPAKQEFVALYVKSGQVVAVLACQRERATAVLIERLRGGLSAAEAGAVLRDY